MQGGHKGLRKGTEKKWSWMVSLCRPWQDPIGQGHGEWNGNREKLYRKPIRHAKGVPVMAKIAKNKSQNIIWVEVGPNEKRIGSFSMKFHFGTSRKDKYTQI